MLKKLFSTLFRRNDDNEQNSGNFIVAQLNDKIGPIDRGLVYEDPLNEFLQLKYYGEVTGGGTFQEETGEIACCDIEIEMIRTAINEYAFADIIDKLESLGAPKGSKLIIEKTVKEIPFGKKEGLAIYLDGLNLPDEVYEECDVNFFWEEMNRLVKIEPDADRNWQGAKETGFYFYNDSFEEMNDAIAAFVGTYPLCKGARIVRIA